MAAISSVQSSSASAAVSILKAADDNTAVAVALLKKANDADKDLVNTLLPVTASKAGAIDIRA